MKEDTIGGIPAEFDNEDNREMILDIIDDYMDVVDAVKTKCTYCQYHTSDGRCLYCCGCPYK